MIAIMVMSSCSFFDDDKSSKETTEVRNIVELPDSIKQKIVEQDALMIDLLNKVDTLTAELNATKTANAELKEKYCNIKIIIIKNDQNDLGFSLNGWFFSWSYCSFICSF